MLVGSLRCAEGLGGDLAWSSVKVWIGHLDAERYGGKSLASVSYDISRQALCSNKEEATQKDNMDIYQTSDQDEIWRKREGAVRV